MATRSVIAKRNEDGTITGVYCHYDGYLDGVGKTLKENYSDRTKTEKLISFGAISSLGKRIGTKHDFNNCPENETNFYHRDRGEELRILNWSTEKEMRDQMEDCEYFYIFELTDKWVEKK